jgi:uroporphyrinogen-III synthase
VRVLITRPRSEALALRDALRARGIDSLSEPMLEIRLRPKARLDLDNIQAILLTSANGARALGLATTRRDVPILAVGGATAQAARVEGFASVTEAAGTVATLADAAKAVLKPEGDPLIHVTGSAVAGDLAGELRSAGFAIERVVLYDAIAAREFSRECTAAIVAGGIDAVLFFSPRSAAVFVNLAKAVGVATAFGRVDALCLSRAVADAAGDLDWRQIRVAARPGQRALLGLLDDGTNR